MRASICHTIIFISASLTTVAAAATPGNTSCLLQCTTDIDCTGCGDSSGGKCKGNLTTTRVCVDAAPGAPTKPIPLHAAVAWPDAWASDIYSLTYADSSDKTKVDTGRFYYDWANMRQLQDFGHSKLIYISKDNKTGVKHSRFYFLAGPACFYVHTEDPLTHTDITVSRPDWMTACANMGAGLYVGRERLSGQWVDHYNCSVTYNGETDSFQTWHSLGLDGGVPFGYPVALAAGDSTPNWEKPRLNDIWYSNVTVGPNTVPASLFKVPDLCLPLPGDTLVSKLRLRRLSSILTEFPQAALRDRLGALLREFH